MLSFKQRFYLNERHNNIANDIKNITSKVIRDFADYFKSNIGNDIQANRDKVGLRRTGSTTDYECIIIALKLAAEYMQEIGSRTLDLYNKEFNFQFRNRSIKVPVNIVLSNEDDNIISGGFSVDEDENNPEIKIYIDAIEVDNKESRQCVDIVTNLIKTISHEVTHCYQYLSKTNYIKGKSKESSLPEAFSYIIYYLQQNEIEAVLTSAFAVYKNKKNKINYFQSLLRSIDFAISETENDISSLKLNCQYLANKYKKHEEYSNLFMFNYIMKYGIKDSRFYQLVISNKDYKEYVSTLSSDIKEIKSIIDEIYKVAEEKFLDEDYDTAGIYWLLRSKKTMKLMLSSVNGAKQVLEQVKSDNVGSAQDEEEDEIVHGRPEHWN